MNKFKLTMQFGDDTETRWLSTEGDASVVVEYAWDNEPLTGLTGMTIVAVDEFPAGADVIDHHE